VIEPFLMLNFALWPYGGVGSAPAFQPWQLLSYAFLHGGFPHLFLNMFALYMFGSEIERLMGGRRFLLYYTVCVLSAALMQLLVLHHQGDPPTPTVGASGGIFGLLLAFGMAYPKRKLMLIFPPIPMPAWLFVTLYGLIELYTGFTDRQGNVAHFAHLGGMVGGFVLLMIWRQQGRRA
jgi:membrane associated rhomboid family serine protease